MATAYDRAQILDRLGHDLQTAAFRLAYSPPSHRASDECIDEVERICAEARAVVRGR